ncbi:diphthamide biosynthesis methyltransferase [Cenarchaeum symbiosum A]|uniref:Diphthamide biosynthesis methyltransferase n=1 Tax=Cenarchaeum symbiosum (strain A) TaxID=414004 RepID=A0RTV4_CENSY|nr:diphthamide biosynthesis methyltransferase [Cenarchaeum symbiosum A]
MLWFVGMGLAGAGSIPADAKNVIEQAEMVYLEGFTSIVTESDERALEEMAGGKIIPARRWMVEDGKEILDNARTKKVVLVSYGDPYTATTHIELRTRAAELNIPTGSIHAASILASAVGECGLHHYKMGRTATVTRDPRAASTPYRIIYENLVSGSHTVLLLEYDQDGGFFLDPGDALGLLIEYEKEQRRGVITDELFAVIASRIGMKGQSIVAGRISSLKGYDFGAPPHAVIIPGGLHFTESEALSASAKCLDAPSDNSERMPSIPQQMVKKYVPMVRDAMKTIEALEDNPPEYGHVLENAGHYLRDAEEFMGKGEGELAVLSVGYADGLVDALRMARGIDRVQ